MKLAATIVWGLGITAAACAQGEVELRIRMPKEAAWMVSQTIDVENETFDLKGKSRGRSPKEAFHLAEKWTDECVEESGGALQVLRRTWSLSKWAIGKGPQAATGLETAVLTLQREGSEVEAGAGRPDEKSLAAIGKGPPEPLELLLPSQAVKAGSTWEVPGEKVEILLGVLTASMLGLEGKGAEDAEVMFTQPMNSGLRTFSKTVPLKARVRGNKGGEVTVELEGRAEFENDSGAEVNGRKPKLPKHVVALRGATRINATSGTPVSLDLELAQLLYDGSSVSTTGADIEVIGNKTTWKFARTYSPRK
jgi:hypothetical protein